MLVLTLNHGAECYMCPVCNSQQKEPTPNESPIYSWKHAAAKGYVVTRDSKFCEPGISMAVICPDCAKNYEWQREEPHS